MNVKYTVALGITRKVSGKAGVRCRATEASSFSLAGYPNPFMDFRCLALTSGFR